MNHSQQSYLPSQEDEPGGLIPSEDRPMGTCVLTLKKSPPGKTISVSFNLPHYTPLGVKEQGSRRFEDPELCEEPPPPGLSPCEGTEEGRGFQSSKHRMGPMETQAGKNASGSRECARIFFPSLTLKTFEKIPSRENSLALRARGQTLLQITTPRVHRGKVRYKCQECGKSFTRSSHLTDHVRVHTGERPFGCDRCWQTFARVSSLRLHARIHTGEKPFPCDQCPKTFLRSTSLIEHLRIHTGERPFQCDKCHKSFTRASALGLHRRMHAQEKPFKCDRCQRTFVQSSSLIEHKRVHTGEKPYKCTVCGKTFTQSSSLTAHRRIHTGEKPFKCELCRRRFNHSSAFARHMRVHCRQKPFTERKHLSGSPEPLVSK